MHAHNDRLYKSIKNESRRVHAARSPRPRHRARAFAGAGAGGGRPWRALIEKNNRVVQNDRHPLMYDWTFCDFLANYRSPEYRNMLYVVTPLSELGVSLLDHLRVPDALRCDEIRASVYEARLWMSGGNTSSSLHFDTHDNLMLQLDGRKEVLLWHPNQVHVRSGVAAS